MGCHEGMCHSAASSLSKHRDRSSHLNKINRTSAKQKNKKVTSFLNIEMILASMPTLSAVSNVDYNNTRPLSGSTDSRAPKRRVVLFSYSI